MNSNNEQIKQKDEKEKGGLMEILRYILVGCAVTLGQLLLILLFDRIIPGNGSDFGWSNLIAGLIMMVVAFFPYKIFVFRSRRWDKRDVIIEFSEFISARIFTVLFDIGFVFLFVTFLGFNNLYPITISRITADGVIAGGLFPVSFVLAEKWVVKFFSLVITTILNYLFSKLVIFKEKKKKTEASDS